ncbi:MAG: enoyl-CoA hydratase-related protein [Alphaproteobacteria bacterium]|jgi:enoyl-CoA hydratase/carnithine racemase
MSDDKTITYAADDRVAVITLNRPDRMNAMSIELCREVMVAIAVADGDDEVRVVILTGAGGKAFSAGYDLNNDPDNPMILGETGVVEGRWRLNHDLQYTYAPWRCSKPVIAMISGYCLASALELAQMCDMRYASDDSRFGVIETRFAAGVVTLAMPWVIVQRCRELIYTGDVIPADEAFRLGLVNRVFPKADLEAEVMKIAKRMSRVAMAALQWNKRALNQTYETMGFGAAVQYGLEACVMLDVTETPEGKKFKEVQKKDGLTAAIRWRDAQFAPFE